jgi:RNA polymerase sigma-70 factor (ECF subfamily)
MRGSVNAGARPKTFTSRQRGRYSRCLMPALDPESLPRHLDRLYRAAWALCGSPHEAEDLVQETFARVLARPRLLRGQDELAYLMTVLRNTFLTQRRTATRRPRASPVALEEIEPVDPRTGDRPEEALQAREVFAAIAALPERYRLALVAVDIAGLSYREAARVLATKEATIATRVFRGRQFVMHALEEPRNPRGSRSPAGDGSPLGDIDASPPGDMSPPGDASLPGDTSPPGDAPSPSGRSSSGGMSSPTAPDREPPDELREGESPRLPREGETSRRRLIQRGST